MLLTPRMNRSGEDAVRGGLTGVAFDPVVLLRTESDNVMSFQSSSSLPWNLSIWVSGQTLPDVVEMPCHLLVHVGPSAEFEHRDLFRNPFVKCCAVVVPFHKQKITHECKKAGPAQPCRSEDQS